MNIFHTIPGFYYVNNFTYPFFQKDTVLHQLQPYSLNQQQLPPGDKLNPEHRRRQKLRGHWFLNCPELF